MSIHDEDVAFVSFEPGVVKEFRAQFARTQDVVNLCVDECVAGWNRLPMILDDRSHLVLIGLALHEKDWDYETEYKKHREANPGSWGFSPKDDLPPPGWRKRVKDDYFTPPLKGKGSDFEMVQDLLRRYRRIPTVRTLLEDCYGGPSYHFAGIRFMSPGIKVIKASKKDGRKAGVWVHCGPNYEVKDGRFIQVPLSDFLKAQGK